MWQDATLSPEVNENHRFRATLFCKIFAVQRFVVVSKHRYLPAHGSWGATNISVISTGACRARANNLAPAHCPGGLYPFAAAAPPTASVSSNPSTRSHTAWIASSARALSGHTLAPISSARVAAPPTIGVAPARPAAAANASTVQPDIAAKAR